MFACGHSYVERNLQKLTSATSQLLNNLEVDLENPEYCEEHQRMCVKTLTSHSGKHLFPYQAKGIVKATRNNAKFIFADEMGLGKGQILSDNILTPLGWEKFGNIKVGDDIIGSDGKVYQITAVYDRGLLPTFKVTFTDETVVTTDFEHLWQVNTPLRNNRKQPQVIKQSIEINNDLLTTSGNNKWQIQTVQPIEFQHQDLPIEPYQLGVLLGDGSFVGHQISFTSIDEEIVNSFNWKRQDKITYYLDYEYLTKIKNLNLEGTRSDTKFIPWIYKIGSIDQRLAILKGLMDTDGSIWNNGVIEYTTVSPDLASDVRYLVESLGGTVKISTKIGSYTKNGIKVECKIVYRVIISLMINPFRLIRKASQYKNRSKYKPIRIIKSVEFDGVQRIRCISVNTPDHLYITNNFIITHNTVQGLGTLLVNKDECLPAIVICKSIAKTNWLWEVMDWLQMPAQVIYSSSETPFEMFRIHILSHDMVNRLEKMFKLSEMTEKKDKYKCNSCDYETENENLETCPGCSGKLILKPSNLNLSSVINQKDKNKIAWEKILRRTKTVIIDETHLIKNPGAQRTKAIKKLCSRIPHTIGMSGTPIKNSATEYFTILNILKPEKFWRYESFCNTYVRYEFVKTAIGWSQKFTGLRDPIAFKEMCDSFMIRRTTDEVLPELPKLWKQQKFVELDEAFREIYDRSEKDFVEWFEGATQIELRTSLLAQLALLRHQTSLAKVDFTLELTLEFLLSSEGNKKLAIFTHHIDSREFLIDRLRSFLLEIGNFTEDLITVLTQGSDVQEEIERFKSNPNARIIILSTLSHGESINLQFMSNCILHERQWNPSNEDQAISGRFRRIGQEAKVIECMIPVALGTIDEYFVELVERKRNISSEIDTGEIMESSSFTAELAEMIASKGRARWKL